MSSLRRTLGIAQSYCWKSPKPLEFGNSGQNWEDIGWRVKVRFTELANKVRPKDHIEILRPFLPDKYSPLQRSGSGLQSVYLTDVPMVLAANGNAIATAAEVADEECIVLIGRIARTVPELSAAALDALAAIDNPLAARLRGPKSLD